MSNTIQVSDRSRLMCLLLWLLCLCGFCGVHRIYVGKVWTGILQFITVGFFGIWQVIDLIILLFGNFEDKNGHVIR